MVADSSVLGVSSLARVLPRPGRHEYGTAMTSKSIAPRLNDIYPVLPLRDIVVVPHMIVPLFRRAREVTSARSKRVMKADKPILLATQMNAADDDPADRRDFHDRHAGHRLAIAQAAQTGTVEGAGRRRRARAGARLSADRRLFSRRAPRRSAMRRSTRSRPRRCRARSSRNSRAMSN